MFADGEDFLSKPVDQNLRKSGVNESLEEPKIPDNAPK
jgi:hypothetical protein